MQHDNGTQLGSASIPILKFLLRTKSLNSLGMTFKSYLKVM